MLHTDDPLPCSKEPETWFSTRQKKIATAKAGCLSCARRLECLADVIETENLLGHKLHGIHGGLTPAERTKLATFKQLA